MVDTSHSGFSPPLWATLSLLVLLGVTGTAGFWQLDRAAEKRALFDAFDAGTNGVTLVEPVANGSAENQRYQRMSLYGRFDQDHQVLLDSMLFDGQAGYQVLTPFRIGGKTVLVNRGWIAANPDRDILPAIPVGTEPRRVSGRLDLLPRPGLRIASAAPSSFASWPRRLLFPTAENIAAQLGYPVMDYQLLLGNEEADGFVREWRPAIIRPERHVAYAVQWFALALTLIVIYVVVNLRRARQHR